MALLAIGLGLYGLRGLGNLHEIRSGPAFRLHPMAGVNVWPDSTWHRSCVLYFGNGARSPWTGKIGPVNDPWQSEGFAIWRRERRAQYREKLRSPNDSRLPIAIERKEGTEMKDDPDDIPMVYLLYVLLAIGGDMAVAAIVVIRIL
ncbi:MAG: hypothetical protein ABSA39_20340 [Edaphobacter sp.]